MNCARSIMEAAKQIEKGVNQIDGLKVLGKPDMSVISFAIDPNSKRAKQLNIFKVGEAMSNRHWSLNTLQKPAAIHICCTYMHRDHWQRFLTDLSASVEEVIANPGGFKNGSAAIYGMADALPDSAIISDLAKKFVDTLSRTS